MSLLFSRRRSLGGAVDFRGRPIYDTLQKVISPSFTFQGTSLKNREHEITIAEPYKELKQGSVDLGELQEITRALQGGKYSTSMIEMVKPRHENRHRRFSVDLGCVREFLARREMKISAQDENMLVIF